MLSFSLRRRVAMKRHSTRYFCGGSSRRAFDRFADEGKLVICGRFVVRDSGLGLTLLGKRTSGKARADSASAS